MLNHEYGLNVNLENVGYVDVHPIVQNLHNVKSVAGHLFHSPVVKSVCVYDAQGIARLYLKRVPGGYVREER